MKVRVYYNLHKHLFSVQEKINGRWKVTRHLQDLYLKDVTPRVYEKGRQRTINEQRKNVHAYIIGELIETPDVNCWIRVTYNPYKYDSFVFMSTNLKFERANYAHLENRAIWVN